MRQFLLALSLLPFFAHAQNWNAVTNEFRVNQNVASDQYLPQLAKMPDGALHAPWTASPIERVAAGVELGKDYPHPIVRHDEARERTLKRYAVVKKAEPD